MTETQAAERVRQSKHWRTRLDDILQEMKRQQASERGDLPMADPTRRHEAGRHLAVSITELENSIMRQGMRMKEINKAHPLSAPNPYPQSYNPDSPVVEKTADGLKL